MTGGILGVLKLFTLDRPVWTVDQVAERLDVSTSSAYRYVAALAEAGLVTNAATGRYVLGPAIIQYDRQIQLTDPLLRVAKPVMADLLGFAPAGSLMLLCRLFRDTVLCVHQASGADGQTGISYERGRPMPLFRGATSTIILSHLPPRDLRRVFDAHREAIRAAGLGETWDPFRAAMARMRRAGHAVSHAEVDPERTGVSVPVFDDRRRVLGSLSYVIPVTDERTTPRLASLAATGAREIEEGMGREPDDPGITSR